MLEAKLDEVKAVMLNGEEMKSRCRDDQVMQLTSKLLQLHRQTCSTVSKANAVQVRRIISRATLLHFNWRCRPSGCTVASGVVGVDVGVGVCIRSQMRTSKCTCLIFGVSIDLDPG